MQEAAAAPGAPMAAKASGRSRRDERRRPPLEVDGDHRAWAWLDEGGNVAITTATTAEGAWARVFRRRDRLLLGLAPLRAQTAPGQLDAIVLVPPVAEPSELMVDVVDDPAAPRRAPTHDRVRQAVLAGRRAARLTRLGQPMADAAWSECADLWRALGDEQRANLALRHGQRAFDAGKSPGRRLPGPTPEPLLADQLS